MSARTAVAPRGQAPLRPVDGGLEADWRATGWHERQVYLEHFFRSVLRAEGFRADPAHLKFSWREDPAALSAGFPMGRVVAPQRSGLAVAIFSSQLQHAERLRCLEVLLHEAAHLLTPTAHDPHGGEWQAKARELARSRNLPLGHFPCVYYPTEQEQARRVEACRRESLA